METIWIHYYFGPIFVQLHDAQTYINALNFSVLQSIRLEYNQIKMTCDNPRSSISDNGATTLARYPNSVQVSISIALGILQVLVSLN